MPNVDKHAPGDFSWIELATSDQNAAKTFYTSLFGWTVSDMPMGPDSFYSMFKLNGRENGAAYTLDKQERAHGVPPHWNLYIAVTNADETASKAAQLGATVLAPAFDVMDAGRMAVIQDPTGAVCCVWQANKSAGLQINNEPGALCWADLSTGAPERAQEFYSALFGWHISVGQNDSSGYLHIKNGENFIGGIQPLSQRNSSAPPHWLIYILVTDVDATATRAKELGATFFVPPMSIEHVGRFAVMADPQGAVSAIFKGAA